MKAPERVEIFEPMPALFERAVTSGRGFPHSSKNRRMDGARRICGTHPSSSVGKIHLLADAGGMLALEEFARHRCLSGGLLWSKYRWESYVAGLPASATVLSGFSIPGKEIPCATLFSTAFKRFPQAELAG